MLSFVVVVCLVVVVLCCCGCGLLCVAKRILPMVFVTVVWRCLLLCVGL